MSHKESPQESQYIKSNCYSQITQHPVMPQYSQQLKPAFSTHFKWLHILYWIIIVILAWIILSLSQEQERLFTWMKDAQQKEQLSLEQINSLEKKIEDMKGVIDSNQKLSGKNLQNNQIKATYIKQMMMEQHYLNKIDNMRQLAKSQKIFKQNQKARISYLLSMNNFKLIHQNIHIKKQINALLNTQYERLSKEHDFNLPEMPFCIVVPTLNNGKDFRYQYNLRSIFNQNYTNYKVVIIDDASTDQNFELISQYLEENPVRQVVHLIRNKERMTAIPNIYKAASEYCDKDDILALVDGDDELLGVNVFKVFNSVYTRKGLEVLYSNIIVNQKNKHVKKGWSSAYTDEEKKFNKYRDKDTRMFPLRSFKVSTFLKIRVSDLKDNEGNWFRSAYDQTICPQVLQLSCGKNQYIDEFFYLYNFGLGNNDIEIDANLNYGIMNQIRFKRKRYECPAK